MTEHFGERADHSAATHVPVMSEQIVMLVSPPLQAPGSVYVDTTLGLGGHARAVLHACPNARLIGIDRDADALDIASNRLAEFRDRVQTFHARYDELPEVLAAAGVERVHAILMDLGVSSMQLDQVERGFSYAKDAPLDMRMDASATVTAAEVVNSYSAKDLARVLHNYGDERFARRIAERIVSARETEPFTRTQRLAELVRDAIPAATRRSGGHPAKRTFQALRIEVNGELDSLSAVLPAALKAVTVGGRVVVMSYQSLEDRMVKRTFAAAVTANVPPGLPVVPQAHQPRFRLLTAKALTPTETELTENPRSASVHVRGVERVLEDAA